MAQAPMEPTATITGSALPVRWILGCTMALMFTGFNVAWIGRGMLADTTQAQARLDDRVANLTAAFTAAVAAGQKERDTFIARFDQTQRQNVSDIETLRAQLVAVDRNAAVTTEKLIAIAASIADIQRILNERSPARRMSAEVPPVEAAAVSRVARREGMRVRKERGIAFVERRE